MVMGSSMTNPGECKLILVTGDRNYKKWQTIQNCLLDLLGELGPIEVVHGDCPSGADAITERICNELNIRTYRYPARWNENGYYRPQAGPERNQEMLDSHDIHRVVVFHDSLKTSRGTIDTIDKALIKGVPVWIYENNKCRKLDQLAFRFGV